MEKRKLRQQRNHWLKHKKECKRIIAENKLEKKATETQESDNKNENPQKKTNPQAVKTKNNVQTIAVNVVLVSSLKSVAN